MTAIISANLSDHSNADCKKVWDDHQLHNEGPYTPPSPTGWTAMVPGAIGGIDWGGVSIDPDRGYAYTNVTNMPTMVQAFARQQKRATPKAIKVGLFTSGYVRFHDAERTALHFAVRKANWWPSTSTKGKGRLAGYAWAI